MSCRVDIRYRIIQTVRIEIAALRQCQAVVKTNARHVGVYEATCGVVVETGCKVVQPYTGNKVVASVPERIERAYSVCVQRRVAGTPSVVSILCTLYPARIVYCRYVSEYVSYKIILLSSYCHSAHSLFVVSVHYVFDRCRICLGVVLRYLFRQDSVSVPQYFSRNCGGKRSSAPD